MALRFYGFNGWDDTTLTRKCVVTTSLSTYPQIAATSGPRSGPCLRQNMVASTSFDCATTSEISVGFWMYVETFSAAAATLAAFTDGGANQDIVVLNIDGSLSWRRWNSGSTVLLETTSGSIAALGWYHIGLTLKVDATVGTASIFINGVEDANFPFAGVTRSVTGSDDLTSFKFGSASIGGGIIRIADLYYKTGTTAFQGVAKVTGYLPTGDGTFTDLTPSAGSNYQCVDDATPDDDATTVFGTTGKDTYTHGALDHVPNSILGVKVECIAKDEDASGHILSPYIVSGATNDAGTGSGLGVSYTVIDDVWETDPDTGVAWTEGGFNAAEFGMEIT